MKHFFVATVLAVSINAAWADDKHSVNPQTSGSDQGNNGNNSQANTGNNGNNGNNSQSNAGNNSTSTNANTVSTGGNSQHQTNAGNNSTNRNNVSTGGNSQHQTNAGNNSTNRNNVSTGGNSQTNSGNNSTNTTSQTNAGNNSTNSTSQTNAGNNSNNSAAGNTTAVTVQGDVYQAPRIPVASAWSAPLAVSNGTCMGSTSGGAQGAGFGFSIASAWNDKGCDRRYNAQMLNQLGARDAAISLMCQDDTVRDAMASAGTPCSTKK